MSQDQIIEIFIKIDDFCKAQAHFVSSIKPIKAGVGTTRNRKAGLCPSEIMTIQVAFQLSRYRDFKAFYTRYVGVHLTHLFPGLVSYNRFGELANRCGLLYLLYLELGCKGECTGINFIDSTVVRVCHTKRIPRHKTFNGLAERSKSTMGWFYGFKLHLIINDKGELLSFYLTKGNVDDRDLTVITNMTKELFGRLIGDKGYISKALSDILFGHGIQLITQVRKNMKTIALSNEEKLLLRKRSVIETVNDELKNVCQLEHTRHRSVNGFLLNIMASLVAYSFLPKKPSIKVDIEETRTEFITDNSQLFLAA